MRTIIKCISLYLHELIYDLIFNATICDFVNPGINKYTRYVQKRLPSQSNMGVKNVLNFFYLITFNINVPDMWVHSQVQSGTDAQQVPSKLMNVTLNTLDFRQCLRVLDLQIDRPIAKLGSVDGIGAFAEPVIRELCMGNGIKFRELESLCSGPRQLDACA